MKVRGVDLRIGWTRAFEECKRVRTARKKKLARNIMDLRTQSEARLAETGMEYLFYYLQCTCDVLTDDPCSLNVEGDVAWAEMVDCTATREPLAKQLTLLGHIQLYS